MDGRARFDPSVDGIGDGTSQRRSRRLDTAWKINVLLRSGHPRDVGGQIEGFLSLFHAQHAALHTRLGIAFHSPVLPPDGQTETRRPQCNLNSSSLAAVSAWLGIGFCWSDERVYRSSNACLEENPLLLYCNNRA